MPMNWGKQDHTRAAWHHSNLSDVQFINISNTVLIIKGIVDPDTQAGVGVSFKYPANELPLGKLRVAFQLRHVVRRLG